MSKKLSIYKEEAIRKALIETTTPYTHIANELGVCLSSVTKIRNTLGELDRNDPKSLALPF